MAEFKIAYDKTMISEGAWVNDADDRGKETYCGVSRVFFPEWYGWQYIDAVKKDDVDDAPDFSLLNAAQKTALATALENFYRNEFWKRIQGDRIPYQDVADELFDSAVNMGLVTAVEFLQNSLNALNRDEKLYPELEVDGKMGGNTLNALKYYENREDEKKFLLKTFGILKDSNHVRIAIKNKSQRKYIRGWLNRG